MDQREKMNTMIRVGDLMNKLRIGVVCESCPRYEAGDCTCRGHLSWVCKRILECIMEAEKEDGK